MQKNEKRNVSSDYHVQYAANHLEKAKDVFMKVMKILWIYIALVEGKIEIKLNDKKI